MILGVERRRFAEREDAAAFDLGDRKACMRAADVHRDDLFAHNSPSPVPMPVPLWNVAQPKTMQQGIAMRGLLRSGRPVDAGLRDKRIFFQGRTNTAPSCDCLREEVPVLISRGTRCARPCWPPTAWPRSEENTSELQSLI